MVLFKSDPILDVLKLSEAILFHLRIHLIHKLSCSGSFSRGILEGEEVIEPDPTDQVQRFLKILFLFTWE